MPVSGTGASLRCLQLAEGEVEGVLGPDDVLVAADENRCPALT